MNDERREKLRFGKESDTGSSAAIDWKLKEFWIVYKPGRRIKSFSVQRLEYILTDNIL